MDIKRAKRGQAFIELAIGMLALALVLAATFGFIEYMISSLEIQRTMRAEAGCSAMMSAGANGSYISKSKSDTIQVEPFAAEYIFGTRDVNLREEIHLPVMGGLSQ